MALVRVLTMRRSQGRRDVKSSVDADKSPLRTVNTTEIQHVFNRMRWE